MKALNLFYEEPDNDRWFPLDRYPRHVVRRIVRGRPQIGGQKRVFLNLCAGLKKLGVPYRVNNYSYLRRRPDEVACVIGKPHLLNQTQWNNKILFGASVFSHPSDDPDLLRRLPIQKVLVPGEWMRKMFAPYYGDRVTAWAVGIDTDQWIPDPTQEKEYDILVYDKVRWNREKYEEKLIQPIYASLADRNLRVASIRYGAYREEEFLALLKQSKAMIFLCEHETQGIAYQQALSCNVPILAWDRGGFWQDPSYFPEKVQFAYVSSVPYWTDSCGSKFRHMDEFLARLDEFLEKLRDRQFSPRSYVLRNLTLAQCAQQYVDILHEMQGAA